MYCYLQVLAKISLLILRDATLCVLDNPALTSLSTKASARLHQAFYPKTHRAYDAMFRTFIAFCIVTKSIMKILCILFYQTCIYYLVLVLYTYMSIVLIKWYPHLFFCLGGWGLSLGVFRHSRCQSSSQGSGYVVLSLTFTVGISLTPTFT